jgi:hypothetical protein
MVAVKNASVKLYARIEAVHCGGLWNFTLYKSSPDTPTTTKKRIIRQSRKALPSSPASLDAKSQGFLFEEILNKSFRGGTPP